MTNEKSCESAPAPKCVEWMTNDKRGLKDCWFAFRCSLFSLLLSLSRLSFVTISSSVAPTSNTNLLLPGLSFVTFVAGRRVSVVRELGFRELNCRRKRRLRRAAADSSATRQIHRGDTSNSKVFDCAVPFQKFINPIPGVSKLRLAAPRPSNCAWIR
jgi:hypothetical protein